MNPENVKKRLAAAGEAAPPLSEALGPDPTGPAVSEAVAGLSNPNWLIGQGAVLPPMIGGSLGMLAGGPIGSVIGATGGSMLGELGNIGYDLANDQPVPNPGMRLGLAGAVGGGSQALGELGYGVASKVLAPTGKTFLQETGPMLRNVRQAANELIPGGPRMAPIRPTGVNASPAVQWLERVATSNAAGRNILLGQMSTTRDQVLTPMIGQLIDTAGGNMNHQEFGQLVADTLRGTATQPGNLAIARMPAVQIYSVLDDLGRGTIQDLPYTAPANQATTPNRILNQPNPLTGLLPQTTRGTSQVGNRSIQTGGVQVDYDNLVKRPLQRISHFAMDPAGTLGHKELNVEIRRLATTPDEQMNWTDVRQHRTRLRELMRGVEAASDTKGAATMATRYAHEADRILTDALDRSMEQAHPWTAGWLGTADNIYRGASREHMPFMINRMLQLVDENHAGHTENVVDRIFGQPGGQPAMGPQGIRELERALRFPDGHPLAGQNPSFERIQEWYTMSKVKEAMSPDPARVQTTWQEGRWDAAAGKRLASSLQKDSDLDAAVLHNRPHTLQLLQRAAKYSQAVETGGRSVLDPAVAITMQPNGQIAFSISTGATRAAAVGGALGAAIGGGAGALAGGALGAGAGAAASVVTKMVLGGEYASVVAARMLTDPRTARWLAEGMRLPAGSRQAFGVTARLIAQASNYQKLALYEDQVRQGLRATAERVEATKGNLFDSLNEMTTRQPPPQAPNQLEVPDL